MYCTKASHCSSHVTLTFATKSWSVQSRITLYDEHLNRDLPDWKTELGAVSGLVLTQITTVVSHVMSPDCGLPVNILKLWLGRIFVRILCRKLFEVTLTAAYGTGLRVNSWECHASRLKDLYSRSL